MKPSSLVTNPIIFGETNNQHTLNGWVIECGCFQRKFTLPDLIRHNFMLDINKGLKNLCVLCLWIMDKIRFGFELAEIDHDGFNVAVLLI